MGIAIITGASSGMGKEFARQIPQFYKQIDEVWLLARRENLLEGIADEIMSAGVCDKVKCIGIDICDREQMNKFKAELSVIKPKVRILVNCAGCGRAGDFADIDSDISEKIIELNCVALTLVTHMVIPYMTEKSHIINLASAAAFLPQPGFNVYSASKAYVYRFSKALDIELRDRKICVTSVCPGPVKTEFLETAYPKGNIKPIKRIFMADPESVVTKAIHDAALNKKVSIYGLSFKLLYVASKLVPECIFMKFIY